MDGARVLRNLGNRSDIRALHRRVGRRLGQYQGRVVAHRCGDVVRIRRVGERVVDAETAQDLGAETVGSTIRDVGDDGVFARLEKREHRREHGAHAGAETRAVDTALEIGEFRLERLDGRVARTRVGETLAQVFVDRRLHVGGRLVDRREDRSRNRIRRYAGMNLPGSEAHFFSLLGRYGCYELPNCNGSSGSTPSINCFLRSRLVS